MADWRPGSEFTLGAEDELLLVDHEDRLLGAAAVPLMAELCAHAPAEGAIKGEIFADEVELETPVCSDADELLGSLMRLRASLVEHGTRAMAVGVHPSAELGTAVITTSARYTRIGTEFGGLLRTPTAGFQVHVGLPDPATALRVFRVLRNRLSVFRALAAASPYWHGRDSGLASVRPAILRSYPRTTMPPALRSWDDYLAKVDLAMAAGEVPDYTYVCWELRPHPRLGTIEVRVMDAQPSLARAAGLAALVQGLARYAVETPDRDDLPDEYVIDNDFRACRHGLDAMIVDSRGTRRSARAIAEDLLKDARSSLAADGSDRPLEAAEAILVEPSEHVRQRERCERDGMAALLADLTHRTLAAPAFP
jgi:carboxylate-amine ligase